MNTVADPAFNRLQKFFFFVFLKKVFMPTFAYPEMITLIVVIYWWRRMHPAKAATIKGNFISRIKQKTNSNQKLQKKWKQLLRAEKETLTYIVLGEPKGLSTLRTPTFSTFTSFLLQNYVFRYGTKSHLPRRPLTLSLKKLAAEFASYFLSFYSNNCPLLLKTMTDTWWDVPGSQSWVKRWWRAKYKLQDADHSGNSPRCTYGVTCQVFIFQGVPEASADCGFRGNFRSFEKMPWVRLCIILLTSWNNIFGYCLFYFLWDSCYAVLFQSWSNCVPRQFVPRMILLDVSFD